MRKLRVVAKTKVIALVNLTSHIGQQILESYRQALEKLVLVACSQQAGLATGRRRRLTTSSAMQIPKRV